MADDIDVETLIDSRIARCETRYEDWDTLGFQAAAGDEFRRAQIRYIGSGATGNHENDPRTIPPMNLTLSNMLLPPGAIGPEHVHDDAEEVFFVLEGSLEVSLHDGDAIATRTLGYRDAISVPPGVGRSLRNPGTENALFCVIVGAAKPKLPWYPESSPMHGVTRG